MRVASLIPLLLAVAVLAGCGGAQKPATGSTTAPAPKHDQWAGAKLPKPKPVPDFRLTDQSGQQVGPSTFAGKAVLLTFLYTKCPDVCPLIAANLNTALKQLAPAQREDVRVLAVSVDPKGDTEAAVRRYVKSRGLVPQFRYLIGSKARLTDVWRRFDVQAVRRDPELVDHVAYTLLVSPEGKGIVLYDSEVKSAQVLHDLRRVLES